MVRALFQTEKDVARHASLMQAPTSLRVRVSDSAADLIDTVAKHEAKLKSNTKMKNRRQQNSKPRNSYWCKSKTLEMACETLGAEDFSRAETFSFNWAMKRFSMASRLFSMALKAEPANDTSMTGKSAATPLAATAERMNLNMVVARKVFYQQTNA